jgi:hypothetical protein
MDLKSTIQGRALLALAAAAAATMLVLLFTSEQRVLPVFGLMLLFFGFLFMWPRPASAVRNEPERQRWARIRVQGWRHFLVQHALLRFALPMALAMTVYISAIQSILFEGQLPDPAKFTGATLLRILVVSAVVWPLAGWLWGALVWRANEKRFQTGLA